MNSITGKGNKVNVHSVYPESS